MGRPRKKILIVEIVEDETILRHTLKEKFEKEDFEALTANDGEEGLKIALAQHPDLILLDILLPKMDGFDMLRKVREDDWGKNVPVIVLTNVDDANRVAEGLKIDFAGSYDYLVKSDHTLDEIIGKVKDRLHG